MLENHTTRWGKIVTGESTSKKMVEKKGWQSFPKQGAVK